MLYPHFFRCFRGFPWAGRGGAYFTCISPSHLTPEGCTIKPQKKTSPKSCSCSSNFPFKIIPFCKAKGNWMTKHPCKFKNIPFIRLREKGWITRKKVRKIWAKNDFSPYFKNYLFFSPNVLQTCFMLLTSTYNYLGILISYLLFYFPLSLLSPCPAKPRSLLRIKTQSKFIQLREVAVN